MAAWRDRQWTSSDGLKLHFRDYPGSAERPPILCLHGLTRNCRDFEQVAERYSGQWRVLCADFRGRGASAYDRDSSRYAPKTYARDIAELLDQERIDRAVFFGTSLGALVTMLVASQQPERIAGVLINDIGPEVDPRGIERIRSYVGKPVRFGSLAEAARAFAEKNADVHPRYGEQEWLRFARRLCRETEHGIELDYDMAIADNFNRADTDPVGDLWPHFRTLMGRPALLLRGEYSDLLTEETAERMRSAVPSLEIVTVPQVGHAPDLSEPEAVAAMDRLLQRVLELEPA